MKTTLKNLGAMIAGCMFIAAPFLLSTFGLVKG